MKQIKTEEVASAPTILSQAIESNGLIFLSGQIGTDTHWKLVEGGVENETRKAFENIAAVLKASDSSLDKVVKVTIYVTDITMGKIINEIYTSYFPVILPAREMVEVRALPLGAQIEISVVAER
jgi:2-iminobutanoate/2-iminopropanoate deaminase